MSFYFAYSFKKKKNWIACSFSQDYTGITDKKKKKM